MHNLDFLTNRELISHVDCSTASDLEKLLAERLGAVESDQADVDKDVYEARQEMADNIMRTLKMLEPPGDLLIERLWELHNERS